MLGLIAIVMIFHLCILIKIIPYEITWGGRLQSDAEMYVFETISIVINLFLFFTLLSKGEYIKPRISPKAVNIILWIFLVIFGLNTIGNVFAETTLEKSFTVLTLISAILIWIILKSKRK